MKNKAIFERLRRYKNRLGTAYDDPENQQLLIDIQRKIGAANIVDAILEKPRQNRNPEQLADIALLELQYRK